MKLIRLLPIPIVALALSAAGTLARRVVEPEPRRPQVAHHELDAGRVVA